MRQRLRFLAPRLDSITHFLGVRESLVFGEGVISAWGINIPSPLFFSSSSSFFSFLPLFLSFCRLSCLSHSTHLDHQAHTEIQSVRQSRQTESRHTDTKRETQKQHRPTRCPTRLTAASAGASSSSRRAAPAASTRSARLASSLPSSSLQFLPLSGSLAQRRGSANKGRCIPFPANRRHPAPPGSPRANRVAPKI